MNLPVKQTETALTVPNAQEAADMVVFLGIQDMQDPPDRHAIIDGATGEIVGHEDEQNYVRRVWDDLKPQQRGEAVYLGLQKSSILKEAVNDGIQLVVFRARDQGLWLYTDSGDGDDKSFRSWVRETIIPEGTSSTEATQLASTILNLEWLKANGFSRYYKRLRDMESIFADRQTYQRWRRVASTLRQLIENSEVDDNKAEIVELIKTVADTDKSYDDLDQIKRPASRVQQITIEVVNRDEVGRHILSGVVTDAQLSHMRMKLGDDVRFPLRGEVVPDEGTYVLRTYRYTPGEWRMRTWSNGDGWSEWEELEDKPDLSDGYPDGIPFFDEDLGVEYYNRWIRDDSQG